jgi:hypothetical protein
VEAQQPEEDSLPHDTIDLEEELGDIDALLADDTVPVVPRRRVGGVELFLVGIANLVWAIVGLVLWFPQAFRAVLGAVLRVIHSALTNQRSDRAVAGIKQVSSLYFDRFLRRRGEPVFVGRRHEARPFRLIGEVAWVTGFYLLLLRWLAPSLFQPAWERLVTWWRAAAAWLAATVNWLQELSTGDAVTLAPTWLQAGAALLATAVLGALLGFWLGRRRG